MPWCTWGPESGGSYTARNPSSTAGGKFQIIDSTWYANGGGRYNDSHPAAAAPPLEQERVARNVLASQGLGAWVNC
jgi:muramidase (phage lysozyme)